MGFLRIGVQCAVFDDQRRVLLSKRGDLDIWNLPGGRAEPGEVLAKTAAREVLEETGIVAYVQQPIALYYWEDFQRMNILYVGWQFSGRLLQTTHETKANAFFAEDRLPVMPWASPVHHAYASRRPVPVVVQQPAAEVRIIKNKLRWRWIQNLLSGKPEPRFPRFNLSASLVVWNAAHDQLLLVETDGQLALPTLQLTGQTAPWTQLAVHVGDASLLLHWVGLWQSVAANAMCFVFAVTIPNHQQDKLLGQWRSRSDALQGKTPLLTGRDAQFAHQVELGYAERPVWTLSADSTK